MKKIVSFVLTLVVVLLMIPPTALASNTIAEGFQGKTISILGDSISTYSNLSNGSASQTTNSTIKNGAI